MRIDLALGGNGIAMDISPRSFDLNLGRHRKEVKLSITDQYRLLLQSPDPIIIAFEWRAEIVLQEIIVNAILCKANRLCDLLRAFFHMH